MKTESVYIGLARLCPPFFWPFFDFLSRLVTWRLHLPGQRRTSGCLFLFLVSFFFSAAPVGHSIDRVKKKSLWVGDLLLHKKASATILNMCKAQLLESASLVPLVDDPGVVSTKPGAFIFFLEEVQA